MRWLVRFVLISIPALAFALPPPRPLAHSPTRTWREAHEAEIVSELRTFLAIPNIASDRLNIQRNADALIAMMKRRGIPARLLTAEDAPPAVYGEMLRPGAKRTIIFYAHYDGQPVDPAQWSSDPWSPVLRMNGRDIPFPKQGERVDSEARIYARSASDDKAPIIAMLAALDALRAAGRRPSVNLKFFFEGEEEAGSDHLRAILEKYPDLLRGDVWLFCDGPVHQSRRMQIYFGARGVMGLEMTVYGAQRSLHSGHYGNWSPNPVSLMADVISGMRASDGRILIDGFHDDVRPLTELERRAIAAVPAAENQLKHELAIGAAESEASLPELITLPALNFHGIQGGSVGAKATNSIPTSATASIDFRLVPNQTPSRVREMVEAHLKRKGWHVVHEAPDLETRRRHPRVILLEWGSGYPAARTELDHPASASIIKAIESATRQQLIKMPTLGGSVPMYLFDKVLQTPVIGVPTVNHDNNQHAANENLRLQNLWDAIEIFAALMTAD